MFPKPVKQVGSVPASNCVFMLNFMYFVVGSLVVSVYASCPDVRLLVTPDLKCPDGKGLSVVFCSSVTSLNWVLNFFILVFIHN